ncbi:MAG: hypothetical protein IJO90_08920, partial [Alistipes sp.]|nr:hypothetical protein [Alistipes sp.]
MTENKIFPYKIDALKQVEGVEYLACKNAALIHIPALEQLIQGEMRYPAKFNGYIAILCARGEVTLSMQMNEYTLVENTLLIAPASVVMFKS